MVKEREGGGRGLYGAEYGSISGSSLLPSHAAWTDDDEDDDDNKLSGLYVFVFVFQRVVQVSFSGTSVHFCLYLYFCISVCICTPSELLYLYFRGWCKWVLEALVRALKWGLGRCQIRNTWWSHFKVGKENWKLKIEYFFIHLHLIFTSLLSHYITTCLMMMSDKKHKVVSLQSWKGKVNANNDVLVLQR